MRGGFCAQIGEPWRLQTLRQPPGDGPAAGLAPLSAPMRKLSEIAHLELTHLITGHHSQGLRGCAPYARRKAGYER